MNFPLSNGLERHAALGARLPISEREIVIESEGDIKPDEAEQMIKDFGHLKRVQEVASSSFFYNYVFQLQRLSSQAHNAAARGDDEYSVDYLLSHGSLPQLVEALVCLEAWRNNVLPCLMRDPKIVESNGLRLSFSLHVETMILQLINLALFRRIGCEALGDDHAISLVDYCARCLIELSVPMEKNPMLQQNRNKSEPSNDIERALYHDRFSTCIAAVFTARYLCEFIDSLSIGAQTRILDTHDYLMLMIPLMEGPPWTRCLKKGVWEKYVDNDWIVTPTTNLLELTKTEATCWLAVYLLTCSSACRERYQLSDFRKDQFLRLRKYLNNMILDQLPCLTDLQRYMDELAFMSVPHTSRIDALLLQRVDCVRDRYLHEDWTQVAEQQKRDIFDGLVDAQDPDLKLLANLFINEDDLDNTCAKRTFSVPPSAHKVKSMQLTIRPLSSDEEKREPVTFELAPPTDLKSITVKHTDLGPFARMKMSIIQDDNHLVQSGDHVEAIVHFQDSTEAAILEGQLEFSTSGKKAWCQVGQVHQKFILQLGFDKEGSMHRMKQVYLSHPTS